MVKVFFFTFPLFISCSPWRIYKRICFKWADNTLFKIYDRIVSFFLTAQGCAKKLFQNYLAIHRINTGKEHLLKVYLEWNFNHSSEKNNKTEGILPTRKPGAIARVFFIRDHSTLAATFDTCCHSYNFKNQCGPDHAISTEKLWISWALHPEEIEDGDVVLKISWYFLKTDRMFLVFFPPFQICVADFSKI